MVAMEAMVHVKEELEALLLMLTSSLEVRYLQPGRATTYNPPTSYTDGQTPLLLLVVNRESFLSSIERKKLKRGNLSL